MSQRSAGPVSPQGGEGWPDDLWPDDDEVTGWQADPAQAPGGGSLP